MKNPVIRPQLSHHMNNWLISRRIIFMRKLLLVPLIFIGLGCQHIREEHNITIRIIEKMPYATPPDLVIEISRCWWCIYKSVLSGFSTWCRARVLGEVKMYKAVLGLFIVSVAMAGEQAASAPVCANGKCQNASESKPRRFFSKNASKPKTVFKPVRGSNCSTCR